jgi:hypothetical protein
VTSADPGTTTDDRRPSDYELRRLAEGIPATMLGRLAAEVVSLRGQLTAATELAEQLNVTCRYHGHHIKRTVFGRPEPCCDTGREAVRNVRLIAALGGAR